MAHGKNIIVEQLIKGKWEQVFKTPLLTKFTNMKAILRKTSNGQFRFNLVADNGEKIATSETYTTKAKALKTLKVYFPSFEIVDQTK